MNGGSDEVVHPRFRMWLRPDGIVQQVWTHGVSLALEDAVASGVALAQVTGERKLPLLVDVHDAHGQDRAARLEFARRGTQVSAVAVIVGTPLSRMMGNIFVNVSTPVTPTQMFDNEASAVAWLQGFKGVSPDGDP